MTRGKNAASLLLTFIALAICSFAPVSSLRSQKQSLRRVVIDAGHGGKDFGAGGAYSHEKDVALAVALKLQKTINNEMSEVDVVMTRVTDVFDNPRIKAEKANDAKGDLFISIHCNDAGRFVQHKEPIGYKTITYKRKGKTLTKKVMQYKYWTTPSTAKGTETYIWGIGKDEDKEKALKENEDLYMDSSMAKQMREIESGDPAKVLLYSLKTQQYAERSRNLALTVEDEFVKVGRVSREAKQRPVGIWVLQAVAMPAILVETGFISNPEEEDYLNSEKGQQEIADVIVKALKRYKYSLDKKTAGNTAHP